MIKKKYNWLVGLMSLVLLIACTDKTADKDSNSPNKSLIEVSYQESDEIIGNPERGFYKHHSFSSSDNKVLNPIVVKRQRDMGISLLLNIYYLTDFRDQSISEEYLARIKTNMETLREGGSKCVLRFAYTSNTENKPYDATQELVLQHIEQLRPILTEFADVIYVVEAGFVGVWGEWYYTSHFNMNPSSDIDYAPRKNVVMALLAALPENRMVCVRTPNFKLKMFDIGYADTITMTSAYDGSTLSRIASHNDCFLASSSDVGTFSSKAERSFWESESKYSVMGGETCGLSDYSTCGNVITQMENFHWSYLNDGYHPDVLNSWKRDGCMDEVAKRLGYRFVLTGGEFTENPSVGESFKAVLKVKNIGFAAPSNPRNVELVFVSKSDSEKKYVVAIDSDPRFWFAGGEYTISVEYTLPVAMKGDEFTVNLNLPDPEPTLVNKADFSIQLANKNLWNPESGYNKVHSIAL